MRSDLRIRRAAAVLVGLAWGVVTGCDVTPEIDSANQVRSADAGADLPDVTTTDDQHEPPPLHEAIADGDLEQVRKLLAAGADVNQHDPVYGTPLVVALCSGADDIVSTVLDGGADRNGTSSYFLAADALPRKTLDSAVRIVADQFAEANQLSLRADESLPALLLFDVDDGRGQALIDRHQAVLMKQGWFLFRFAHNARRREDVVGLLPTSDKYVVLAYLKTDGLNYNITTERIIDWLRRLEADHPFALTEVGLDYVGGKFLQPVRRPGPLAERMYAFCPDIVDQGVGSVANLGVELAKPSPSLYLWWD